MSPFKKHSVSNFGIIQQKLKQFITKYYFNELIRGIILFLAIGFFYFLITLLLEYFLWLNPLGRTLLFWIFIAIEAFLFYRFIIIPIGKLLKFHKGIDPKTASRIIGNHFPEVSDTLLNVLQLAENHEKSELLLASIDQKSVQLQPIPFHIAINYRKNIKYTKYIAPSLVIILLIWLSGNLSDVSKSYERIVNYQLAYEPPAPFQFRINVETLNTLENKPFTLKIKTVGTLVPENVQLHTENENYFMRRSSPGNFEYTFPNPKRDVIFYVAANGVRSKDYQLRVTKVPVLIDFQMALDYPAYTKKSDERIKNTGNASVPEGTKITWLLHTKETDNVNLMLKDTSLAFSGDHTDRFSLSKRFYNDLDYTVSTSNRNLSDYEKLSFTIDVIKDAYPEIEVTREGDLTSNQIMPFSGLISDDYGLSKLQLVYYPETDENDKKVLDFPLKSSNFSRFTYTFPENVQLQEGIAYTFYFQVFDNDALRGGKSAKSPLFNYKKLTSTEREKEQLQEQEETLKNIGNTLEELKKQENTLENLSRTNKEKETLNFNEKRKLNAFLDRQQQQEQLMQKFTRKLQNNLEEFQQENPEEDPFKTLLKERLERERKALEKNEKLIEELQKLSEKIQQEELSKSLEKLAIQQKNSKRNLEQLLELTKRYYVSAKASKLQRDLEKLAKEQEALSQKKGDENTSEKQEQLNTKFEEFQEENEKLQQENEGLKKPMNITRDENAEQEIKEEQQKASEDLEQSQQQNNPQQKQQRQQSAQQRQKNAARKMKQMSQKMQEQMQSGSQEQASEDSEMLRQILDNLVVFSFEEESLLEKFSRSERASPDFSKNLRRQNELRTLFQHVDDSLFALSLRRPEVSEIVNKEISNIYFNIDKALERLAETRIYQGVSSQRYALTSANNLADFLSNVLDNMQDQMGKGKGKSPDFQLPDIIQSQEQLNQQMQNALQQQSGKGKPQDQGAPQQGEGKKASSGSGNEENAEQLYEIYKRQQQLRQLLEQQLNDKEGKGSEANELLKEMEEIENELLENGFRERTLQRMLNLKHELLKLEDAALQQGKEKERKSTTNQQQFINTTTPNASDPQKYFNQTEILDRQVLPLYPIYKRKVEKYFKKTDPAKKQR